MFQALEDAFLAIDSRVTTEEVIKELVQIAGRPQEEAPNEKVAEEDDCKYAVTTVQVKYVVVIPCALFKTNSLIQTHVFLSVC